MPTPTPTPTPPILLKVSKRVVGTTADHFIGLTLDYANICNRTTNHSVVGSCVGATNLELTSHLAHLASMNPTAVSPRPGIMRIGGSLQDSVLFLGPGEDCPKDVAQSRFATASGGYQCSQDLPNGKYGRCFTTDRMEQLCRFAGRSNQKLVIGLNACMGRRAIGAQMNLSMVEPFLRFVSTCEACKNNLYGFELGNELDLHVYHRCDGVEPEALGADIQALSELASTLFASWPAAMRPRMAGPDIAAFTGTTDMPDGDATNNYYTRYLKATKPGAVSAMTFHQYIYCDRGGDTPGLSTVIDLDCLARLKLAGTSLKKVSNAHDRRLELWVGESSNEWTGGIPNRSDVVFDAFYYAEQLQAMATSNVSVVVRQDLLGMYYQLLSYPDLTPKPSYWVAFMWKLLVGKDVFALTESIAGELPVPIYVHASVHCGRRAGVSHTAVIINFHNTENTSIALAVPAQGGTRGAGGKMTAFVLKGAVYSDRFTVNGIHLDLHGNGSLPVPRGLPVHSGAVAVPPQSITFIELAGDRACS